jgi:hypothetical protein
MTFQSGLALRRGFALASLLVLAALSACGSPPPEPGVEATATPLPFQFIDNADGCGDVFVYKSNAATTEYITAWISARAFGLSSEPTVLDLAESSDDLQVVVDVYSDAVRKVGEFPYCNDTAPFSEPIAKWRAIAGSATVTLSADPPEFNCAGEIYEATVVLTDLVLTDGENEIALDKVQFENVPVGWCAG